MTFGEDKKIKQEQVALPQAPPSSRVVTFGGPIKPPTGKVIDFPSTEETEIGTISKPPGFLDEVETFAKRKAAIGAKAITGDVPFIRQLLPEDIKEVKPFSTFEKSQFALTRFARDIGLFVGTQGAASAVTKIPAVAGVGRALSKVPIARKIIPEFAKGFAFGAATAGSEDPSQIAKAGAGTGAFFAGIPLAVRGAQKALKPLIGPVTSFFRKQVSPLKSKVKDLTFARFKDVGLGQFESEKFVRNLESTLTKVEREAIPFVREGTKVPKGLNRPDITQIIKANKPKLSVAAKEVGNYLDDAHKFLLENYGDDVGFVENFIPRFWDIPKNKVPQVVKWFVTRAPFLKNRSIKTIQEGVDKFGLKPKTLDIAELIRIYDQYKIKAVSNLKFIKSLQGLTDDVGTPVIQSIKKGPADWVTMDHPALRKVVASFVGKGEGKKLLLNRAPVKVHPEIANEVNAMLGRPFNTGASRTLDTFNAFAKKAALSLSMFHPVALTETGGAAGLGKKMVDLWNPVRAWKTIKNKRWDIFTQEPITKDAIRHGVVFGSIPDVQVGRVRDFINNLAFRTKRIPVIGSGVKKIKGFNDLWDKSLWDYYHNGLKLYGYEKLSQDAARKFPNIPPEIAKRETANFVNNSFGGQAWDLMMKSPKWQQAAHWLLLSPDWTLSTIKQAVAPFGLFSATGTPAGRKVTAELGKKFWEKGSLYFFGSMNLLNKAYTEAEFGPGKGRYMWDNAPGHKTHLFIGRNPDGTESYLRWGKQFRELPEFFIDPIGKFGSKLSPAIRQTVEQFQARSFGKFGRDLAFKDKGFLPGIPQRLLHAGTTFTPFSARGFKRSLNPLSIAFPISKGLTPFETRNLFKSAIESGDQDRIKEIWRASLDNNLDALSLFKTASSSIKSDLTFERRQEAFKLFQRLKGIPIEQQRQLLDDLRARGLFTKDLEKQLIKLIQQQRSVDTQRLFLEQREVQ